MHIPTLTLQLSASYGVGLRNLAEITHEESLSRPPAGGNSLNWVVGHLVASRNDLLEVLGRERLWEKERDEIYQRGSQPITAENARPFEELVEAFRSSHPSVVAGLETLAPARLAEKAPFSPGGNPEETVASLLALFAFHEAYHVGQTGILRRVCGHAGAIA